MTDTPPASGLRWTLRTRLVLWLVGANLLVLTLSVFITDRLVRSNLQNEPNWSALAAEASARYGDGDIAAFSEWTRQQRPRGYDVLLFRGETPIAAHPLPPHLEHFLPQLLAADAQLTLKAGEWQWLGSVPMTTAGGETLKLVALKIPRPPHQRRGILLASQLVLSVLVISLLGALLAGNLTRPIVALQAAVRRMADGDLGSRSDARTRQRSDEIGALARDFNHMAARTETLVNQQRAVLQDVSHELRSPLARLHVLLELARRGAGPESTAQLARAEQEVSRLDGLIGEVLDLSRLEATLPGLALQPLGLRPLIEELLAEHGIDADARQIRLQLTDGEDAVVQGDAHLLARALGNVLGNALKFGPVGSTVTLALAKAEGRAQVTVCDQGPGIPAGNLPQLFRPFYRGDNAALASGHGLGLAIAQRIVGAHGGQIAARNAPEGGLEVTLTLPCAA